MCRTVPGRSRRQRRAQRRELGQGRSSPAISLTGEVALPPQRPDFGMHLSAGPWALTLLFSTESQRVLLHTLHDYLDIHTCFSPSLNNLPTNWLLHKTSLPSCSGVSLGLHPYPAALPPHSNLFTRLLFCYAGDCGSERGLVRKTWLTEPSSYQQPVSQ